MTQLVWSQCSERKRGGRELELRKWESLNQKGETTSRFSPFEERERERENPSGWGVKGFNLGLCDVVLRKLKKI